jgi:penicillin-binding protein 1A
MRTALDGMPESTLDRPPGLVFARIDPNTGKLAPPDSTDAIFEVFSSKYTPKEITDSVSGTVRHEGDTSNIQDIF